MLTAREIRMILEALRVKEITLTVEQGKISTDVKKLSGYSTDPEVGALQAKLSVMLEVPSRGPAPPVAQGPVLVTDHVLLPRTAYEALVALQDRAYQTYLTWLAEP